MKKIVDLTKKPIDEDTVEIMEKWLRMNADILTNKNEKYNLKVGDVITFKNGYDVPIRAKIIAFNKDTGNPYLLWDCYWCQLELEDRLLKRPEKIEITEKIKKINAKANSVSAVQNQIIEGIAALNKEGHFTFGYRSACGTTDITMKVFRLWSQALKELEKQGIYLRSESLVVGNPYATNKGGFWNEVKYYF